MSKVRTADEAALLIGDGATVAVNSLSGLLCPDAVPKALGARLLASDVPRDPTTIHPITAGDIFGTPGVDHLAHKGMRRRIIGGCCPSGPSEAEAPLIWERILADDLTPRNVPAGVSFDLLRHGAAYRAGGVTKVDMETCVTPDPEGVR